MTERTELEEFEHIIRTMDDNERAMLFYSMKVIAGLKSAAAKNRRWDDFKIWIDGYRAEKDAA